MKRAVPNTSTALRGQRRCEIISNQSRVRTQAYFDVRADRSDQSIEMHKPCYVARIQNRIYSVVIFPNLAESDPNKRETAAIR